MNIERIKGYSLFDTDVKKDRVKELLKYIESYVPDETIQYIVPNMGKAADDKISISGFFVFLETIIFEFRDFLAKDDFDSAKWDKVTNIRINTNGSSLENKMITVQFKHGTSGNQFSSIFSVFGEEPCALANEVLKKLHKNLISF